MKMLIRLHFTPLDPMKILPISASSKNNFTRLLKNIPPASFRMVFSRLTSHGCCKPNTSYMSQDGFALPMLAKSFFYEVDVSTQTPGSKIAVLPAGAQAERSCRTFC